MMLGVIRVNLVVLLVISWWLWLISFSVSLFLFELDLLVISMLIENIFRNILCRVICGVSMCVRWYCI